MFSKSRELKDKKALLKEYKEAQESHNEELAVLNRSHNRTIKKKNEALGELEESLAVLQNLENNRIGQQINAIELDAREQLVEAKENQYETLAKEIKAIKKEATEEAEIKYQTGYSDGLADGLRKIHEITAEDRKQAMQVAALAASSHTPGAAKRIAQGIQDSMLLGGGEDDEEEDN